MRFDLEGPLRMNRRRPTLRLLAALLVVAFLLPGCAPKPDSGGGTPTAVTPPPAAQPGPAPAPAPGLQPQPPPAPGGTDPAKPSDPSTKIPEDYPHKFCPIYEPSTVVKVTHIAPTDEDFRIWIIELVSKDEPKVVEAFYLKNDHFTDSVALGDLLRQVYLYDADNGLDSFVNIEPPSAGNEMAEHAKKGYKSYIVITVGKE